MTGPQRPVLLCYDGSDSAKRAVARAGEVLGGGGAVVLCVWESLGSLVLRHRPPGLTEVGRELREISTDVVDTLDGRVESEAQATADEGAEIARSHGFEATALARRALGKAIDRQQTTIWEAVIDVAEEEDVALVVLGSRGLSPVRSALLGSVSSGVVHHCERPVLIVPPARD
ncbi:MAG TPA: universal stress protein [Thermoleophilaceae bacterium]|nr:universal stress protein [Thermoleophilaceae bacterium]